MLQKLKTLYHLSFRRKYLFVLTLMLSLYSFLMMKFFNRYATFGKKAAESATNPLENLIILDICVAIKIVDRYVPWENVCRHQAYQAKLLCSLYQIPYQIFVGFKRGKNGQIEAHAWTMAQGKMITGFCNPKEYTVQAVYGQ